MKRKIRVHFSQYKAFKNNILLCLSLLLVFRFRQQQSHFSFVSNAIINQDLALDDECAFMLYEVQFSKSLTTISCFQIAPIGKLEAVHALKVSYH
jgi:hypothetical protein